MKENGVFQGENEISETGIYREPKRYSLKFTGNGYEYFKIWIVNIALSIVTLGIYSAWAKVRNKRYIYSNTILDDSSFEYTANPIGILRGRILAFVFISLYLLSNQYMPLLSGLIASIFIAIMPYLVVKSMRFKTRYSKYRNISFGFNGSYGDAYSYLLFMSFLIPVSLGFAMPYVYYCQNRFLIGNIRFGNTDINPKFTAEQFYGVYFMAVLMLISLVIFFYFTGNILMQGPSAINFQDPLYSVILMWLIIMPCYFAIFLFIKVRIFNIVINNSLLGENQLLSTQKVVELFIIYLTNLFGIIFTLGIYTPWAVVRLARYRAENFEIITRGDIDEFVAGGESDQSAFGEEIGEFVDIDFAF
jgi:uncharacterized membrane protein YjgN (DUF898 family)